MRKPWHAAYAGVIPEEIDAQMYPSVADIFEQSMAKYADQVAFVSLGAQRTYAEVNDLSRAFGAYLQTELGVKKGDRVAVMMPNIMAFPIALIAIARIGAVQVNVNPLYTPHELEHQMNDSGAETMVIFTGSTPTLAEVIGKTGVKNVITVGLGDGGNADIPSPPVDDRLSGTRSFADALVAGAGIQMARPEIGLDDTLFLQYTGGTTGLSKGAVLSHGNLVANVTQFKSMIETALREGEEVVVTALPLYHIFALTVNMICFFTIGSRNHFVTNPRDPEQLIGAFRDSGFSVTTGVNTLYAGLVAHPDFASIDFSNYRAAFGGGSAVMRVVSDRWKEITGHHIVEGYGLSETSPVASFNMIHRTDFTGTVGVPMPSSDIKLLGDDDAEVAQGEAGEVCIKGPHVMSGYWNRPDANAEAFTADGYFRTGDIGTFNAEGFLSIVDRKKDMVLVSGFNVYPNEIEAFVAELDDVVECAAVGVPDDKTGEAVRLFVVKKPGCDLTEDKIVAHCRAGLTGYKVPHQIRFIDELPKSTVGKILRRELRDV